MSNIIEKLVIGNQLKKLGESLNNQITSLLKWQKTDLDSKGWIALKSVKNLKTVSIQNLAGILHLTHPAAVQLVNQLSISGYLESKKGVSDKRNTFLQLTEKGEQTFAKLQPVMSDAEYSIDQLVNETGYDIDDVVSKLENSLSKKKIYSLAVSSVKSKQLHEVKIVPFDKKYKPHFKKLNIEWLEKYFTVEPVDEKILSSPEKEILKKGGEIFFALIGTEVVGTCAILNTGNGVYELAKMAVTEEAQGKQVGKKLGLTAIGFAVSKNAEKIVLDTNSKLDAAINLYRSLGFLTVPHKYDQKYIREVFRMELILKEE